MVYYCQSYVSNIATPAHFVVMFKVLRGQFNSKAGMYDLIAWMG